MKDESKNKPESNGQNRYGDSHLLPEDVPQEVIPDEVPRKDGPGGE